MKYSLMRIWVKKLFQACEKTRSLLILWKKFIKTSQLHFSIFKSLLLLLLFTLLYRRLIRTKIAFYFFFSDIFNEGIFIIGTSFLKKKILIKKICNQNRKNRNGLCTDSSELSSAKKIVWKYINGTEISL